MTFDPQTWAKFAAFLGGGIAIGFGAIGAAIGEGYTAAMANAAISRSPKHAGSIFKNMLVGQAVAESSSIFALVVAMILLFSKSQTTSMVTVASYLGAGLCIGLGALGCGIGSGLPSGSACEGMARQPAAGDKLMINMLIGSAICQTPSIFALVVSFILLFSNFSNAPVNPLWAAILGAGLCTGLGGIGSGIGSGAVARTSCEGISRNPESANAVTNIMLLGQAISQTPAILSLLISFILIFKKVGGTPDIAPAMAYLSAGLCMGLGAIGPGIGEGIASSGAVRWIARNMENSTILTRTMLVGMAVAESTAIYSMVIALVLIFMV